MRRFFLNVLVAVLLAAPAVRADDDLLGVVRSHFKAWDADADGVVSPAEIDALTQRSDVKGEEAAAVATLKIAMRRKTDPIKELPRDGLERIIPPAKALNSSRGASQKPRDQDPPASQDNDDGQSVGAPGDLERRYRSAVRRIKASQSKAFTDDKPDLASFHQGPLGDCYFVSMVGAMAYHRPDAIRAMITTDSKGKWTVDFPKREPIPVPRLTDAQLAISSTSGKDGLWLPIIEHAFGESRQDAHPERDDEEPTDIIARGGSTGSSIEVLTGHAAKRLSLSPSPDKPLEGEKLAQRLTKLREILPGLIAAKRLVALGTCKEKDKMPPGVNPSHAYAVLDYDAKTDRVTIWNPHGNAFKPKGPSGIENGWPTRSGKFEMQLTDMVRVFRGFSYESDEPVKPKKPTEAK